MNTTIYSNNDTLFVTNKYSRAYNKLIATRIQLNRSKSEDVYYENHHIIPKSMGGSNNKSNMVLLTAKEHFIAHLLLPKFVKLTKHKSNMTLARLAMADNRRNPHRKYNSSRYELARIQYSKIRKMDKEAHNKNKQVQRNKSKHSKVSYQFYNFKLSEWFRGTIFELSDNYDNIGSGEVRRMADSEEIISSKGWVIVPFGKRPQKPSTINNKKAHRKGNKNKLLWYNVETKEYFSGNRYEFADKTNLTTTEINIIISGNRCCKNWMVQYGLYPPTKPNMCGLNIKSTDTTIYNFHHQPTNRTVSCMRCEISSIWTDIKFSASGLCDLIKGRCSVYKGIILQ